MPEINYRVSTTALNVSRVTRYSPVKGRLNSAIIHFPAGCNSLVEVFVNHRTNQVLPQPLQPLIKVMDDSLINGDRYSARGWISSLQKTFTFSRASLHVGFLSGGKGCALSISSTIVLISPAFSKSLASHLSG